MPCLLLLLVLAARPAGAQFEQKMSLNLSGGYFNTLGWTSYDPAGGSNYNEPTLMPNFKGGPAVSAGVQYNFSRNVALEIQFGYSFSPGWYYDASDESQESFNYLRYEIYRDTINYEVVASGENYMDLTNIHIGIAPRYYFLPATRINPYVYAGISLNLTSVYYEEREFDAYLALGREDEWEGNHDLANWFSDHTGLGFLAGAGAEYAVSEHLGLVAQVTYHHIPLKSEAFVNDFNSINYHDISIQLGVRLSFLKSRKL